MWTTFTTTVRTLLHTPSAVVWTLIFPIVLATVFNFMFEPLRAQESVEAIDVAVVDDDAWRASPFSQVIDALATQDEPLLRAIPVDSTKDARSLVKDGQADGAFSVQSNGEPLLVLAPTGTSSDSSYNVNRAILESILTSYLQNQSLVANVAQSDPAALENASAIEAALSQTVDVAQVSLTRAQPNAMVRFYYALLGMGLHLRRPARRAKRVAPAAHRLRRGSPARRLGDQPNALTHPHHRRLLGCVDRFSRNRLWLYLPYRAHRLRWARAALPYRNRRRQPAFLRPGRTGGLAPRSHEIRLPPRSPHGRHVPALAVCGPLRTAHHGASRLGSQSSPRCYLDQSGLPRPRFVLQRLLLRCARAVRPAHSRRHGDGRRLPCNLRRLHEEVHP